MYNPDNNLPSFDKKPESMESSKQLRWEAVLKDLDSIKDKLGEPIEQGIKETVAAFIVNGFPTDGSCEGHVEERDGRTVHNVPYVGIGFDEPETRFVDEAAIRREIASFYNISEREIESKPEALDSFWDYINSKQIPETPEFIAVTEKNRELRKNFKDIWSDFYKDKQAGTAHHLISRRIGPASHFNVTFPQAEGDQFLNKDEVSAAKETLQRQQAEMREFTEFLKEKFFRQEGPEEDAAGKGE